MKDRDTTGRSIPEKLTALALAAALVGGGTAAGALLGALVSGGEAAGTVAGAAVGAAAGTAITLGTKHQHAYLPEGSRIGLRVTEKTMVPRPGDDGEG